MGSRKNQGALFKNDRRRDGRNDPEYNGTIDVDGVEYWISAWVKNARNDPNHDPSKKTFFSLGVSPKRPREQQQARQPAERPRRSAPPPPSRQQQPEIPPPTGPNGEYEWGADPMTPKSP